MSLLRSRRPRSAESRSGWIPTGFPAGGGNGFGGVAVDSVDSAHRTIAFSAAMGLIVPLVTQLPLRVYDKPPAALDKRELPVPEHLLNPSGYVEPSGTRHTTADWLAQILASLIATGNSWGQVLDTSSYRGKPYITQCDVLGPDSVREPSERDATWWNVQGQRRDDLLHWRARPAGGRRCGRSLIADHAIQIGLPQVAALFGFRWFSDGAHPSALLTNEFIDASSMNYEQARQFKAMVLATTRGTREPLILGRGWKYDQISVTAEESQFLDTLGYSQAEVARLFGPGVTEILGYEVGSNLAYSNPESRASHLYTYTLRQWILVLQDILKYFVPAGMYPVLDTWEMLNGTAAQLYKSIQVLMTCGVMRVNEARGLIGLAPIPEGDRLNPIAGANIVGNDAQTDIPGEPGAGDNDPGTKKPAKKPKVK